MYVFQVFSMFNQNLMTEITLFNNQVKNVFLFGLYYTASNLMHSSFTPRCYINLMIEATRYSDNYFLGKWDVGFIEMVWWSIN